MKRDRNNYYANLGMTQAQFEKAILKRIALLVGFRIAVSLALRLAARKLMQRLPD